ncbi:uncharacterized protein LOC110178970 [Drosophila serrata]|uniref:uncharacterized protein LOC110178970 n=1 Tax=Drosophila serrata TaxID=7274 RepID=UPI000A1D097E|nr:uncharacterized protein LOC110178970 [Drosophila serrata]
MQLLWDPQSVQWKIAILIIALVADVSCIRNGNGEENQISVKLKNFFPSEQEQEVQVRDNQNPPETSARVTSGGGFRPSQMLDFTPSDVMPQSGIFNRFPPSYLEPNYRHEIPSSLGQQQHQQQATALDKQFSFPQDSHAAVFQSTPLPTTPVVSYLDPYTQQNYRYTPTPPSIIQYQREQAPQDDQAYTVQSSLLVGGNHQQPHQPRPGHVDDVYLKRPGYVFDESPIAPTYRRPTRPPTPALPPPPTTASQKISYDSHDYPPPSYAAQQTSNFVPQQPKQRPLYQRQDINGNRGGLGAGSGPAPAPASSNYANNFDNYLQRPKPQQQHQQTQIQSPNQVQPQFGHYQYNPQNVREGGGAPPGAGISQRPRPGHNYYEYQIGEIPPPPPQSQHFQQPQQQFNYRPATQSSGGGGGGGVMDGGLATLASLLSSTQQYAPQFTNLLLGGGGGSSSQQSASPLGSLLGAFAGTQGAQGYPSGGGGGGGRPANTRLIRALENIARNDDLQCVPKVLCQMIAGQTLRGQLPGFVTSPAITNFLAGFPVASPALIYGRAALLGLSGGDRSCIRTYEKCPKNEMEIIHYLNNHRGGFFKFFSEPEEKPETSLLGDGGTGSLFSILSALTGGGGGGGGGQTYTTPRPPPRPTQRPTTDITSGIGSFFTQVLSEYLNGVEYQRRRRRRSLNLNDDFHDEEDNLDTQSGQQQLVKFQDDEEEEAAKAHTELIGVLQFPDNEGEGRVVTFKDIQSEEEHEDGTNIRFPDATPADVIREFNRDAAQRKLRFPQDQDDKPEAENVRRAKELSLMEGWKAVLPNGLAESDFGVDKRRGKRIVFRDTNEHPEEERLQEERLREEEQFREAELREQQIREESFREEQLREEQLREDERIREEQLREDLRIRKEQLQIQRLHELQLNQQSYKEDSLPPNAVYDDAAPPQRGARVIFPDHYEQHIRKGKILNRPTYAPTYEYNDLGEAKEDRLVVSSHYRLEGGFNSLNHGEFMPGTHVRFGDETGNERPNHYNYPNSNYISDNRYGSGSQKPSYHEDDKNIYVTNSQGVNEYYIRPDGRKVYFKTG